MGNDSLLYVMQPQRIFYSNNVVQVCLFIKPWTVCSNMHEQACQQPCSSWPGQPCMSNSVDRQKQAVCFYLYSRATHLSGTNSFCVHIAVFLPPHPEEICAITKSVAPSKLSIPIRPDGAFIWTFSSYFTEISPTCSPKCIWTRNDFSYIKTRTHGSHSGEYPGSPGSYEQALTCK